MDLTKKYPQNFNIKLISISLLLTLTRITGKGIQMDEILRIKRDSQHCPSEPEEIEPMDSCVEMGCKENSPCQTTELKGKVCCSYKLRDKTMNCCLMKGTINKRNGCSKYLINPGFDCLSPGCEIGSSCSEHGLKDALCCSYEWNKSVFNCCLALSEKPSLVKGNPLEEQQCPAYSISQKQVCRELGCNLGDQCLSAGLENQSCCQHVIRQKFVVNCCVKYEKEANSTVSKKKSESKKKPKSRIIV